MKKLTKKDKKVIESLEVLDSKIKATDKISLVDTGFYLFGRRFEIDKRGEIDEII